MDVNFIEENIDKVPINFIAEKLEVDVINLCQWLRKKGYIQEIQPIEVQYIKNYMNKIPMSEIQEHLGLSKSQLEQIRERFNFLKAHRNIDEYTEEEVNYKTKWLIEEKLRFEIDDFLPKKVKNQDFSGNDLYSLLKYGEKHKKLDPYFKYFSTVAFLVCKAYPQKFKPYQFSHSPETKKFFTRKNYLKELLWILEHKLGLEEELLNSFANMHSFLTRKELNFYGLGYNVYKDIFKNKEVMVDELLKFCKIYPEVQEDSLQMLRIKLLSIGIDIERCYINGCLNKNIEIHHIAPKKIKRLIKFDIDSVFNLIPLCKEHHIIAGRLELENISVIEKEQWREYLKEWLITNHA
ncbi:HNH endonuclease signature motif containing protein [Priestia megaterium]|uniref:HNH endonuclease signature motif containing protein n=1 Tax=Priestia megaterium TaxID=1404 RepID=UPI002E1C4581|nr:HNH endonuclease signature motif containing protein [Priestia megaterium]